MVKLNGMILDELAEVRDKLFESLPTGAISSDAFNLIKVIKEHIKELDRFLDYYENLKK